MTREDLKSIIIQRLDAVCQEHPAKHQGSKARRYLYKGEAGKLTEMMFQQDAKSPPNLWLLEERVSGLLSPDFDYKLSAANRDPDGKFGRHSAMKPMPQLAPGDLVCFNIQTPGQLDRILDALDAA